MLARTLRLLHRDWLRQAGAEVDEGVVVEISPLFALEVEELRAKVVPGRGSRNDFIESIPPHVAANASSRCRERLSGSLGHLNGHKEIGGIEIVLARLVDHTNQLAGLGLCVGNTLV